MSVRSVSNEPVFFVMMATQTILAMTIMSNVRHRNKRIFILFVITLNLFWIIPMGELFRKCGAL